MKARPFTKIHGGKHYLAKWVIEHLPPNHEQLTYIEPYCGAASVLLNKPIAQKEVLNDIDPGIYVLVKTIRDCPQELIRRLKTKPYHKDTFVSAHEAAATEMEYAVNEFILRRMSRGGMKKAFAWSERLRGGKPGDVNAWETIIDALPRISERLQGVEIRNEPAVQFLERFVDNEDVVIYADPPYLQTTRQSAKVYEYEMTKDDHMQLSDILSRQHGYVLLSGYPSPEYEEWYHDWSIHRKQIANHASQQKIKAVKTECLWTNY